MNIVSLLSSCFKNANLSGFVSRNSYDKFSLSVEEQQKMLDTLGEPRDDYERSYYQYKCHCLFQKRYQKLIPNIIAFFIFPPLILWCLIKGLFIKFKSTEFNALADVGTRKVAPEIINQTYKYSEDLFFSDFALKWKGLSVIFKLVTRYPFSTFFVAKLALKISYYEYMICRYRPLAIIVENEYSYTSSVLTQFCEQYGVKHIDVMHGEKLFYVFDSYFRFHECYVWSQHYIDLLTDMKAVKGQFIIAVPDSLKIDCSKYQNPKLFSDFKYYLCRYDKNELLKIIESMDCINKSGKRIKYRPHPFWSDIKILENVLDEQDIEYPSKVSIQESISNTNYVVGSYSTVLTQAFYSGKEVVLDDVTYKNEFEKLKSLRFIFNDNNSIKLSDIKTVIS